MTLLLLPYPDIKPEIFSIGPGYFVQAYDLRTSDALRQGLGLTAPAC